MTASAQPTVTAVLTVYNRTAYLAEALKSVLSQDFEEDIEIVVVDDGSHTPVADGFRAEFPTVRWVRQANLGVCTARQVGCDLARGTYVAFLDDDDAWHPTKTRLQVDLLRARPQLALVGCDFTMLEDLATATSGFLHSRRFAAEVATEAVAEALAGFVLDSTRLANFSLRVAPLITGGLMFPRATLDMIGGWDRAILGVGDCQDLVFRASHWRAAGYVDRPLLGLRRTHTDHMTYDRFPQLFQQALVLCSLYDRYPTGIRRRLRRPLLDMLRRTARQMYGAGQPAWAMQLSLACLRRGGANLRTVLNTTRYAALAAGVWARGCRWPSAR